MGFTPLIILLAIGLTSCLTTNETQQPDELQESQSTNTTARQGRQVHEVIELPTPSKKTKRQVIKIPPNVSKVKLVQPPLNIRHNRAPQQFGRHPSNYRRGGRRRPTNKKSQENSEYGGPTTYDDIKVKRNLKKPIVREVSREEFYRDEGVYEERKPKPENLKKYRQPHKLGKRKRPKQAEYDYEGDSSEEEGELESSRVRYRDSRPFYGYDPAGSSIHMKEVPAPSMHVKEVQAANILPTNTQTQQFGQFYEEKSTTGIKKLPTNTQTQQFGQFYEEKPTTGMKKLPTNTQTQQFGHVYEEKSTTGMNVKKLPTKGRQAQSLFSQQYTTHNPQVTTNFGLGEVSQLGGLPFGAKGSFMDVSAYDHSHVATYNPIASASEHYATAIPAKSPGIQVIQPPQFRDVTVSHPSLPSRLTSSLSQKNEETSSQKATIRDILEQDCPGFDKKGYCDSPPRYPMQQIKNMIKKCATLMEAMNTQPYEEPQETYAFSKRSGIIDDRGNTSVSLDLDMDTPSTWSRSSNDDHTACISDLELTEPGYAKEVNSGRWFVVVQHPDTTIQRIATDTCRTPGKSCGGLSDLKCTRISSVLNKSTRCVQRHTYQRLISWDPETPDECPRMRVFRFPSACICHLGVV